MGKETRPGYQHGTARRFVLGLSRGTSSTALLHLLDENVSFQLARSRAAPFELTVIYVPPQPSEDPSSDPLAAFRQRYPRFTFQTIPLSFALSLPTINWAALQLPPRDSDPSLPPQAQLTALLGSLPSAASRADLARLLIRHILIWAASSQSAAALLLGHSTTALAELTLSETAKGRGFALPWTMHDGHVAVRCYPPQPFDSETPPGGHRTPPQDSILVYHPLRDVLRKELVTFATLTSPPLTGLIVSDESAARTNPGAAVVSHKDLSIEEVMVRYFAEVEENYPSIVANVARTTGKLVRLLGGEDERRCGLCSMPLDELGDERWRGELGIEEEGEEEGWEKGVCYGCQRSTRG